MSAPVAKRVIQGIAAHGFSQVLGIVVQLVGVPLFISQWGVPKYGDWIALTALPGYLTITDLSFGATAANEMTMLAGAGREAEAQKVYRSAWVLILGLSFIVLLVASGLALTLPFERWLDIRNFSREECVLTMLLLIGQIVLAQQGSMIGAAYRAGGFYPVGLWVGDGLRVLEFVALVAVLLGDGGPVLLTGSVLAIRAVSYAIQYVHVRRLVPWLSLGFKGATREAIRPIIGPALAYNAVPLAQATTLQGSVLAAKIVAGPQAAVLYATTRTVTRLVLQVVTMVTNSAWPEFSRAIGMGDLDLARRLHRRVCQLGVWISVLGSAAMLVVGPYLYTRWTRGEVAFHPAVFGVMLLAVILNSVWSVSYAVPVSVNRHQRITYLYLVAAFVGLACSFALGRAFGVLGVTLGLIPVELISIAVVLPYSMKVLEDDSSLLSLARPPFGWLWGRIKGALGRGGARA